MKRHPALVALISFLAIFSCTSGNLTPEVPPQEQPEEKPTEKPEEKPEEKPKATELTLLFTNDVHSQILPTDLNASYNANRGGLARIKVLADSVRTADRAVLLCDAGDFVQGSYYFTVLGGDVEMMAQKELGYDIKTIGNHEFDKKMTGLDKMLALNDIPTVSSNLKFVNTPLAPRIEESRMLELEGLKIGFIGLNVRLAGLVDPNSCVGVEYEYPLRRAENLAKELKDKGADMVIALSHLGYAANSAAKYYDRGIALNTRNIDMIIGGHSHTFLNRPDYVQNLDGRLVPIVQTGSKGVCLGYMKVSLNEDGTFGWNYRLIPVDKRLDPRIDPVFAGQIENYSTQLDRAMGEVLAQCPVKLRKGFPQGTLSNFTADAMVEMCETEFGVRPDFALYNNGGIRAEMTNGDVTRGDIYNIYPFDNKLTLLELNSETVRHLFEALAKSGGEAISSGVRMRVKGNALSSLTIGGEEIEAGRVYRLATINYLVDSKNSLGLDNNQFRRESDSFLYELFSDYVKSLGDRGIPLTASIDERIVIE